MLKLIKNFEKYKFSGKIFFDITIIFFSVYIGSSINFGYLTVISKSLILFYLIISIIIIAVNFYFKIYHQITRFLSNKSFLKFLLVCVFSFFLCANFAILAQYLKLNFTKTFLIFLNKETLILTFIFYFLLSIFFRISLAVYFNLSSSVNIDNVKNKFAIYGAGSFGYNVYNFMHVKPNTQIINFIDDDLYKIGRYIDNIEIVSFNVFLKKNIKNCKKVFICIPSASKNEINRIVDQLSKNNLKYEIINNHTFSYNINDISEFKKNIIEKEKIFFETKSFFKGKKALITGAGGSIGSEIVSQLIDYELDEIILVDNNELKLSEIETNEYFQKYKDKRKLKMKLINLCNIGPIRNLINDIKPNVIFHTAAYKHLDIVEDNPIEGVYNNIKSLVNILRCTLSLKETDFVFISTDKAVNPINYMGKSKRLGELIVSSFNVLDPNNKYINVRFGNVIGSSGSLIPKIKRQILNGEIINLTDKLASRYFMTLSDAAFLSIASLQSSKTEEDTIILKMGDPINIYLLIKKIIKSLHGSNLSNKEIENKIKVIGLRKGEKLHEELYYENKLIKSMDNYYFREKNDLYLTYDEINIIESDIDKASSNYDLNIIDIIFKKYIK